MIDIRTLNHLFFQSTDLAPCETLLSHSPEQQTASFSTAEFKKSVLALSSFLKHSDLSRGDRVAILSENRPEWHIADFAVLLSQMVVVPIYPTLSAAQWQYLLSQSGCSGIVLSKEEHWKKLQPLLADLPQLRCVISMDSLDQAEGVTSLSHIRERGASPAFENEVRSEACAVHPDSLATIIYTSGTTGVPRGVMLSHRNLVFDLEQCLCRLEFQRVEQALSVLPLSHAFERLLCYGYFYQGIPIAYGDPYALPLLFRRYRPASMGCVPRILERIFEAVREQIAALPGWKRGISGQLLKIGYRLVDAGGGSPADRRNLPLRFRLADSLLFSRVRRRLGGRMRFLVCGGARLDVAVEKFFLASGISVIQGYGLTETSPVISLSRPAKIRPGTVGLPLDGVEIRFGEDGELLTRGAHVMQGYYQSPEQTQEAFEGDWFRTGDLGEQDEDGYLRITGRKKEILVTSTGESISPVLIEERLRSSPLIEQAIVVGDGRKFISALIVPRREEFLKRAGAIQLEFQDLEDLFGLPEVLDLYWAEIEQCQALLSPHQKVRKFSFLKASALDDPDVFTPTQKIRRAALEQKYRERIDAMYRSDSTP